MNILLFLIVIFLLIIFFAKAYAAEDLLDDILSIERTMKIVVCAHRQSQEPEERKTRIIQEMQARGVQLDTATAVTVFFQQGNFIDNGLEKQRSNTVCRFL